MVWVWGRMFKMVDNQQACAGLRSYSEAVTNVTSPLSLPFKHATVKIEVIIHPKHGIFYLHNVQLPKSTFILSFVLKNERQVKSKVLDEWGFHRKNGNVGNRSQFITALSRPI